jgi:hypothetical protein
MNLDLNPEPTDLVQESAAASMLIEYEVEDLERELRAVQKKERKHFIWALTGISPAALIPMIGLFLTDSFGLLVLLALLVPISQFYLGVKASGEASRLKKSLEDLRGKE